MPHSPKDLYDLNQLIEVTVETIADLMGFLSLEARLEFQAAMVRAWDLGHAAKDPDPHELPTVPAPPET